MNKSNDIRVINAIECLKSAKIPFGIKHNNRFIKLNDISINIKGELSYIDNNNTKRSVSSFIRSIKGLPTARWLNHLYFINADKEEVAFKKYISNMYNNMNFS